jgi:hypothetical protein
LEAKSILQYRFVINQVYVLTGDKTAKTPENIREEPLFMIFS